MRFHDISLPLGPSVPEWPGQQPFSRQEERGTAITSRLAMSSHYGTHIDAPKHFLFDGKSIDEIPVSALVGKFKVFAVSSRSQISLDDIRKLKIAKGDRILFRTRNSSFIAKRKEFTAEYVSLSPEAAAFLAKKGVILVGTDYFGIEAKGSPGHLTHMALLGKGIVVVEGLSLKGIAPGTYDGAILPLKIADGDGAPARAVLWK